MTCPICQAPDQHGRFCGNCGSELPETLSLEDTVTMEQPEEAVSPAVVEDLPTPQKRIPVKAVVIACVALVAVIAVLAAIFIPLLFQNSGTHYAVYIQDEALILLNTVNGKTKVLTEELFDGNDAVSKVMLSDDGKRVFYPQAQENSTHRFELWMMNTSGGKATMLADDVCTYAISSDGSVVTYMDIDGVLYQHDLRQKTKIAELGKSLIPITVRVSPDGKRIVYETVGNLLYVWEEGGEPRELGGMGTLYMIDETLAEFYYVVDDERTLYKWTSEDGEEKIADHVTNVYAFADGSCYYTSKENAYNPMLSEFVEDDLPQETVDRPVLPERQDYGTNLEYEQALAQYRTAMDVYAEYVQIVSLREELMTATVEYTGGSSDEPLFQTVQYYDGNRSTVLTTAGRLYSSTADVPVGVLRVSEPPSVGKIKLSQLTDVSTLRYAVRDAFEASKQLYIVNGETIIPAPQLTGEAKTVRFSRDGTKLVYREYSKSGSAATSESMTSSRYITLENGNITSQKLLLEYGGSVWEFADGTMLFAGNEVYRNDELIDSGEHITVVDTATSRAVYTKDYSEDSGGTLMLYESGKAPVKIADGMHAAQFAGETVVCLEQTANHGQTLYVYKDGKLEQVQDSITDIVDYETPAMQITEYGSILLR